MAFTFFFRDEPILKLTVEKLVPTILGRTKAWILDAGCAMGMETYSFAILLAEKMGRFALRNVKIHAVDIDNENVDFGKTVMEGIYHKDVLQRVPSELLKNYFSLINNGDYYLVKEELRSLVHFQKYDLLSLKPLREDYSLIICKNVLLHFNQQQRIEVLKMFHKILLKDGLLVMENTQNMPPEQEQKFEKVVDYAQVFKKRA